MNVDIELMKIIKKIRMRIAIWKILNYIIFAVFISAAFGVALALISRFVPIYNVYFAIAILIMAAIIIFAVIGIHKRPDYKAAALKADSLGLDERSVTALELINSNSAFALIQKQDALKQLSKLDYKRNIKFKPNVIYCALSLLFLICIGISAGLPNRMADRAEALHKIKKLQASEVKKVDDIEKQIEKNDKISDFVKEDVKNKLDDLKKDIRLAQSEKDINKEIEKADKKIELAKDQYENPDLKNIEDTLAKNSATKSIADAIKKLDESQLKEQIKKAADGLKNLTDEQKKDLSKNLSDLSKTLKDNPDLAKAMNDLSQKLANGELGDVKSELSELQKSASELMKDENIKNAMAETQKQLAEAAKESNNSQQSSSDDGTVSPDNSDEQSQSTQQSGNQSSEQESGQQAGQGSGQQAGQGSGQGQGSGTGQGSGQGDGQGSGGSGAGNGTGMSDSGPSGEAQAGNTGLGKDGPSEKKTGEYEKVYTPKNLGGQSDKSTLTGKKTGDGSTQTSEADQSLTEAGESVPYNQVVGEYTKKAYEGLGSSEIPDGMKNVVKNYFTSLGQ